MNPEERVGRALSQGAVRAFGPGFGDRVMTRLGSSRVAPLNGGLERWFVRLVPVALAAAAVLAAINLRHGGAGQTKVEAMLGLPVVTLAAAYELGDLP